MLGPYVTVARSCRPDAPSRAFGSDCGAYTFHGLDSAREWIAHQRRNSSWIRSGTFASTARRV